MFLPGESQGRGRLVGYHLWGLTESDTTEVTAAATVTEMENIKKRWEEYTEKLYRKKGLNYLDNHNDVITHLETDILECEVEWVLGSIMTNS